MTIASKTNKSGVIRPQRTKANVTGKFPRFISRLDQVNSEGSQVNSELT